jgi:anaerobic selenocysteine-containing dehydrogenase
MPTTEVLTMSDKEQKLTPESGVTRRQFVVGAAAVGGTIAAMPLLGQGLEKAFASPFENEQTHGVGAYAEEIPAERVIYTTCEQCQTFCTIKVALTDPAKTGGKAYVRKIAGNPYSPLNTTPFGQIPYATAVAEAAKGSGDIATDGRSFRGGRTCLKGQAGIQTAYDAYRIAQPLKRVGPRGSGKWQTLSWEQALTEIGAAVKPSLAYAPKGPVMADWEKVGKGEMSKADFDAKYKDVLIDTNHPDAGPKANQVVFLTGNRLSFIERWVGGAVGSLNVFNHGGICGASSVTANVRTRNGNQLKKRQYADLDYCDYLIAWGTNPMTANKGPTWLAPRLTNAIARGMKLVVIDPRLSKTAEKAHLWVPVKPGQDTALAFGMIRRIVETGRYDARYLANPNQKAAAADGEPTWSDATHLVNLSAPARPKLKGKDVGLTGAAADGFVVLDPSGAPAAAGAALEGQLEVDTTIGGIKVKSAFTLLKERVMEHTLAEYAAMCGVPEKTIIQMADEFTSHGKRAVVMSYRGPAMHTNGFYAVQAIGILNFLIGNHDWKGGENSSAVRYAETTGKRYDVAAVAGGRGAWGIPITREKVAYDTTTFFKTDGYPAKRTWYTFGASLTAEVIPSAYEGYPYPVKALFLNRLSPVESVAGGHAQAEMLKDEQKLPLVVAFDIVIGGTSQYADYILPDVTYLERFNLESIYPNQNLKESHMTQPAVKVMDGPRMVEDVLIDLGKQLGLKGVGDKAFPDGTALNSAVDFYLKVAANIAYDETPVPDASPEEQRLFVVARQTGLGDRFDEAKWKAAVKPEEWPKVVYVLNRGGRFAAPDTGYEGEWLKMRHGAQVNLYDEAVAKAKSSYDGKFFDGVPRLEPVRNFKGQEVADSGLPLQFINWKSSHMGTHRTIGDAWLREIRSSNPVWIHPQDAAARGLKQGDKVKVRSASYEAVSEVHLTEAIRPGVVGADFSYGHETFGAKAMEIDGKVIPAASAYGHTPYTFRETGNEPTGLAPGRGTGFRVNDLARLDDSIGGKGSPLVDPIGGSCSQLDTRVEIVKA